MNKYISIFAIILAGAFAMVGCGSDEPEPSPTPSPIPTPEKGDAPRPTEWLKWQEQEEVKDSIYLVTSMTIVCDNDGIEFEPDAQDMVGAFINGQCRGCATADMVNDSTAIFSLSVHLLDSDPSSGNMVTYKYYSQNGTKIYTYGPDAFVTDAKWGSYNDPYHFYWE